MKTSDSDLDRFRLPPQTFKIPLKAARIVAVKQSDEWFIKGPIPGEWLVKADKLSGRYNLRVALTIQYVRGLQGSNSIVVERFHFNRFGVKKDSARRALERLKEAGLIEYAKEGQKFKVTILTINDSRED